MLAPDLRIQMFGVLPDLTPVNQFLQATVSQETGAEITSTIEEPYETNTFTAPELTIKGRDRTGAIQSILTAIGPNNPRGLMRIVINRLAPQLQTLFVGYIVPTTISFDPREGWYSFTAVGLGKLLSSTAADTAVINGVPIIRAVDSHKWTLLEAANKDQRRLVIHAAGNPSTCDFLQGDQIQIVSPTATLGPQTTGETVTIAQVTPADDLTSWTLAIVEALSNAYPVESGTNLLTPYLRNVDLHDLVDALFVAAGLTAPTYQVGDLPDVGGLFVSPIAGTNLPQNLLGLAPYVDPANAGNFGKRIWAGSTVGLYEQATPPSGSWILKDALIKAPPIDATNYGVNLGLFGNKKHHVRITGETLDSYGPEFKLQYYAYDFSATSSPFVRYILIITQDQTGPTAVFPWTIALQKQTSTDKYTWVNSTLTSIDSGTTTTDISEPFDNLAEFFGVDIDPLTGIVYFTDIVNSSGVGSSLNFNLSSFKPGTGLSRNLVSTRRGTIQVTSPGRIALFGCAQPDPTVYSYDCDGAGHVALHASAAISPWVVGSSIRYNSGDANWYALSSDPQNGVYLIAWNDETFSSAPTGVQSLLVAAPPAVPVRVVRNGQFFFALPYLVDLIVWRNPAIGSGAYPMYVMLGSQPYFLGASFSGVIQYADMNGLSCSDALAQLSVLVAAVYYSQNTGAGYFRTRSVSSGTGIGTLDVPSNYIDDNLMISINQEPVFRLSPLYVRIENENDKTIFGEAGDVQYADNSDFSLILSSRFVTVKSYAVALATSYMNYLGRTTGVRWVEVQHFDDNRDYGLGNVFIAFADNAFRDFQIIETSRSPFGRTLRVQGIEL